MKLRLCFLNLILLTGLLTLSGCPLFLVGTGAVVGAGTAVYIGGELKVEEQVDMNRAWNSSQKAMKDLEFRVTKSQKDVLAGEIVALRADDTKIIIRLKKRSDQSTEFRIRAGTFGDESLSRLIHEKIKSRF
ncbi:MAG: DUF3568 family protein [Nitrospinae bacterium]|nr:DUF3568 family protein [Nitrospinota bacterium]